MTGADIVLEDVTVAFEGRAVPALDRVSLSVRAGERLALVGPSGAGKSTLLRLLLGGVRLAGGRVRVGGLDPFAARQVRHLRQFTGFVRQRDDLVPGVSARTNILMGQSWSWRMSDWWAVARGGVPSRHVPRLAELAAGHGIADILGERVENLSGGQRQRVALARALLGDPRLLLADETTSGLDPVNAARAVADLTSAEGATVVLSTHDVILAGRFPRVVALRAGRIAHDGAPPDARETELIYAH